jgi:tripartite-type tricarboxylate transporter receptor subunit TctC
MLSPLRSVFATLVIAAVPLSSHAQANYPTQPIRVIVPFPPGGGTDQVARLLVAKVRAVTGWMLVVDNRPGAGGNIGMDLVAKSKPDGYTLGLGQTANLAINPSLYPKMPYDVAKDFTPVAMVAGQPVVLVVNGNSGIKTLADLVSTAKQKPGTFTMASAGNGTVGHLTGEIFSRQAGIKVNHIPYKGAGPAATDLMGGQIDFYFATPQSVMTHLKSGKLRAIAVSSARKLAALPNVPTMAESYAGFDTSDWKVLVGPKGLPEDIVRRLNEATQKAMEDPDTISQLAAEGSIALRGSPTEAGQILKSEHQRWGSVVREGGIKFE